MELRLFGEVRLLAGDTVLDVGTPRQQAVLAALAVDAGRPVTVETLIDRTWGDAPPAEARNVLYSHLSRIRQLLKQATEITGVTARIDRRSAGYVLDIDPEHVDVHRFARIVGRCADPRMPDVDRAATLTEALGLWRRTPLAGVSGEWVAQVRESWQRRRLDAVVRWGATVLELGDGAAVIAALPDLIGEYPLAEPLEALFMRALHAAGRDAEAIERYIVIRERFAEELGADPGAELRELHTAILRGELPAPERAGGGPLATPAQLPPDMYGFAGRDVELRELDGLLDGTGPARIVAVSGSAGVGKTALAVHWAHRVRGEFPGGQLYVNLRGFDPTGTPVTPAEAVRGFLDAFEVPTKRIPTGFDAQVGLFRSLLATRRVLIVLDNARDTDQVRSLLAGSPGCLVLITSRILLTGLVAGGAHPLVVDLLDVEESRLLLAGRLGADRVAAEPVAVKEIVELCARLPLAMAVVAARAATHPRFSLAALAGELRAATGGLDEFADDDPAADPRAVFSWSYLRLNDAAARMFRLIGLHTGPDIGARAAASLAGLPLNKARPLLAELARAHLIAEHRPGRYSQHNLLRAYASELAQGIDSAAGRRAALRRVLVHYVHSAYAADGLIDPQREELSGLVELVPGVTPQVVANHDEALNWFASEHRVLLNMLHQDPEFDAEVWELSWTLQRFLTYRGHWHDGFEVTAVGIAAGRRLRDLRKEAFSQSYLGCTHAWFAQYAEAATVLDTAIELYRRAGDPVGEAYTEISHAWSLDRQGRVLEAVAHAERSLELFGSAGTNVGRRRCSTPSAGSAR